MMAEGALTKGSRRTSPQVGMCGRSFNCFPLGLRLRDQNRSAPARVRNEGKISVVNDSSPVA